MLAIVVVVIAGMWFTVWLQQRQAERLHSLVSALRVGESTFAQSQELSRSFESSPNSEKCDPSECRFIVDAMNYLMDGYGSARWFNSSFLRRLGIRPAGAWAAVTVKNGRVQDIHSEVFYEAVNRFWIYAYVDSIASFTSADECSYLSLQRHPGYVVLAGHVTSLKMSGASIKAVITPQATPAQRAHAQFVDFHCMTALRSCSAKSSDLGGIAAPLMPLAYDLLPSIRTRLSMISDCGKGQVNVEGQAQRSGDDRGAQATGSGTES